MANRITLATLVLVALLILINDVDVSSARRGGGGRSRSRSSRSRSTSSSSRPAYKGTYGYTSTTWLSAFQQGQIYGGLAYLRSTRYSRYPNKMPTICKNIHEQDADGNPWNLFVCPQESDPDDHEYCCGDENKEHCCASSSKHVIIIAVVVSVIAVVVAVFAVVLGRYLCKLRQRSNQEASAVKQGTTVQPPKMNDPPPSYPSIYTTSVSAAPQDPTKVKL